MISSTYRLELRHLASYQFAVKSRLEATPGVWWLSAPFQAVVALVCIGIFTAIAALSLPWLGFGRLQTPSFLVGLILGIFGILGIWWLHYFSVRQRLVRPDGPTPREHRLYADETGITLTTAIGKGEYRWAMFEDLTERDDVLLLWYEPGGGIVIPRSAFLAPDAYAGFLALARAQIAAKP